MSDPGSDPGSEPPAQGQARRRLSPDQLPAEADWQEGLALFAAGEWFTAHEVLERLWRGLERGSEAFLLVQGVLQLAVGLEHLRRNNPRGAQGQWQKAEAKLAGMPEVTGGIRLGRLRREIAACAEAAGLEAQVERQRRGEPVSLPPLRAPVPERVTSGALGARG